MDVLAIATVLGGIAAVFAIISGILSAFKSLQTLRNTKRAANAPSIKFLEIDADPTKPLKQSKGMGITMDKSSDIQSKLLNQILARFNIEGLKHVCFALGIDHETIEGNGGTLQSFAQGLIEFHLKGNGSMLSFVEALNKHAPKSAFLQFADFARSIDERIINRVEAEPETPDHAALKIEGLLQKSCYSEAASFGEDFLKQTVISNSTVNFRSLGWVKFKVQYGKALMYVGKANKAESLLKEVIVLEEEEYFIKEHLLNNSLSSKDWNRYFGLAHNHIGYISWMEFGSYSEAIEEFILAITYLQRSDAKADIATAYDNLGRVWADLGWRTKGEFLIEEGYRLRRNPEFRDEYREALSLNSKALASLAFGRPFEAEILARIAVEKFKLFQTEKGRRGYGLALLTRGKALRLLGSVWRFEKSPDEAKKTIDAYFYRALEYFQLAKDIFIEVNEPIRILDVLNEVACLQREFYFFWKTTESNEPTYSLPSVKDAFESALDHATNYPIKYADCCEDLARVYIAADMPIEARKWLRLGEEKLANAPAKNEEHYLQKSKIQFLEAHISLKEGIRSDDFSQAVGAYFGAIESLSFFLSSAKSRQPRIEEKIRKSGIESLDIAKLQDDRNLEIIHSMQMEFLGKLLTMNKKSISLIKRQFDQMKSSQNKIQYELMSFFAEEALQLALFAYNESRVVAKY